MDKRIVSLENGNILAIRKQAEKKTRFVTGDKEIKYSEFTVVDPGVTRCLKDEVIYTLKNKGTDITLNGIDYTIVNFADVLLRISPE